MLLERETELEALALTLADACDGEGGLVLIEGGAGSGKTELIGAADELAHDGGALSLVAHASELERDQPFGVVVQLLGAALAALPPDERRGMLDGPSRLAAPLFPALGAATEPAAPDPFALVHGVYWLVARLATRAPLLLAVDDVQWVDDRSLQVLRYVAARIADLPVALVVAGRDRPLDTLARADEPIRLRLRPLSPEAVAQLALAALPDADAGFCASASQATAGVPLLVHALLDAVRTQALPPTGATLAALGEVELEHVARAVLDRLAALPPGADALARTAAVLGEDAELRHAARLAELDPEQASRAFDALCASGVVERGDVLRLRQPIVRAALEGSVEPAVRARHHLAAAKLLLGDAAPPERVAGHLLHAERQGRRWVTETLRRAAARAMAHGAPRSAARYLDRALSEPVPEDQHAAVLLELARAEAAAGLPTAPARIRAALEPVGGADARARALAGVAGAGTGPTGGRTPDRWARATLDDRVALVDAFVDGLLGARDRAADPEATQWLEATLLAEARDAPVLRARALTVLGTAGEADHGTAAGRAVAAQRALELALAGRPEAHVRAGAEAALGRGALLAEDRPGGPHLLAAIRALMLAGDLQSAELALALAVERARESASPHGYAHACALRADLALRRGSLADADADARAALEALELGDDPPLDAAATLALTLLEHGDAEGAAEALDGHDPAALAPAVAAAHLHARAHLHLHTGAHAAAHAAAVQAAERLWELGIDAPAVLAWRTPAALALLPDDPGGAQLLAARQLDLARQTGAAPTIGAALRLSGLVHGGEAGLVLLEQAVVTLEHTHARLERAHALADLGCALRTAGRRMESRRPLREALGLAQRAGAATLEARVDEALAASGERHRRTDPGDAATLSPVERRVVDLATDGLTAEEISGALFLTSRAVDWHLRSATRKLDSTSRERLLDALGAGPAAHP